MFNRILEKLEIAVDKAAILCYSALTLIRGKARSFIAKYLLPKRIEALNSSM